MKKVTKRQKEVLDFIAKYAEKQHCPPTIQEVANRFGIKSSTAFSHVKALVRKGKMTKNRSPRSMRIVDNDDGLYGYSVIVKKDAFNENKPVWYLVRYDMETGQKTEIARFMDYGVFLLFMDEIGYSKVTEMGTDEQNPE